MRSTSGSRAVRRGTRGAGAEARRRGSVAAARAPAAIRSRDLALDLLEDRVEQLAACRANWWYSAPARHAGGADDLLGADVGVAALGEQLPGGGDQRAAGRGRALGLGAGGLAYIQAVCMLRTGLYA